MTEPKRPEFKLHKKPEPLPDPKFCVRKDDDGKVSIEMAGVTVLGGLSMEAARNLQYSLYMAVVEPQIMANAKIMRDAQCGALAEFRASSLQVRPGQLGDPFYERRWWEI